RQVPLSRRLKLSRSALDVGCPTSAHVSAPPVRRASARVPLLAQRRRMRSSLYVVGALFAVSALSPLRAQTGSVSGRVTEGARGQPVPGVTVSIGSRLTQTRQDGQDVLTDVPVGTDSVRFRLIGFAQAVRAGTATAGEC